MLSHGSGEGCVLKEAEFSCYLDMTSNDRTLCNQAQGKVSNVGLFNTVVGVKCGRWFGEWIDLNPSKVERWKRYPAKKKRKLHSLNHKSTSHITVLGDGILWLLKWVL